MDELDYRPFDADNHYYEALDAFTRHLDPAMGPRCVQWCEIDGRRYHVLGGQVSHAVVNPTFDPIALPGAMHDFFRGNPDGRDPLSFLTEREPIRAAYRDREARIAQLDEHGLDACWMFPTLGMVYEAVLAHDPVAVCTTFRAFNRWLIEDWGFAHRERIFAAPYLTLADPEWAVEELEWALDNDVRLMVMLPMAPTTETGRKNPFDPHFDRVWQLLNDSGVTLVLHAGDGGVSSNGYAEDGFGTKITGGWQPSIKFFNIETAIKEWLISFMFANMPARFPNLRVASVENGAEFLPDLFRKLTSTARKIPGYFSDDPIELFRRNVWINPFWEDDAVTIVELMGADRVLFGSDWPHIEGMPAPLDYVVELKELSDEDRRKVLSDNVRELTVPRPV